MLDGSSDNRESYNSSDMVPTIEGFSLRGGDPSNGCTGFRLDTYHTAVVRNVDVQNARVGIHTIWCMESVIESCNVQNSYTSYKIFGGDGPLLSLDEPSFDLVNNILVTDVDHGLEEYQQVRFVSDVALPGGVDLTTIYYVEVVSNNSFAVSLTPGGTRVDITSAGTDSYVNAKGILGVQGNVGDALPNSTMGQATNANSNVTVLRNCHSSMSHSNGVGIDVMSAGNFLCENCTVEGSLGDIGFRYTNIGPSGNVDRREIRIDQLWIETTVLNTVFDMSVHRTIARISGMVPSRASKPNCLFIDATGSYDSRLEVHDCDFYNWNGTPAVYFKHQTNATGDKLAWIFQDNTTHPSTPDLTDPALWDGGNVPSLLTGRTYVRGTRFETF
jgi:hypothetical protein